MSLYKAMSEEDVMKARFNLLEDGDYDAVVKTSLRRNSSSGNVMADISLSVYDNSGNSHDMRDFLVFTDKMLWKLKHFCDSSGQGELYASERFTPEDAAHKNVRVRVRTQKGSLIPTDKLNGKPEGSFYPDKNVIEDYLPNALNKAIGKPSDEFINDSIPF